MTYTSMTDWIAEFRGRSPNPPGQSLLEKLPNELLEAILLFVKGPSDLDKSPFMIDNLPGSLHRKMSDYSLYPCLLTSHRLSKITLPLFYWSLSLTTISSDNFTKSFAENLELKEFVREMILPQGKQHHFLSPTLSPIWTSLPNLRSLHIGIKNIDGISAFIEALQTAASLEFVSLSLLCPEPSMLGLAFPLKLSQLTAEFNINKLQISSGEERGRARELQPMLLELLSVLLPQLPRLQTLSIQDLVFPNNALSLVHPASRIKHLNLRNVWVEDSFPGPDFIKLVTKHPAFKDSLVSLAPPRLNNCSEAEILEFCTTLPPTLKSLDTYGITLKSTYVGALRKAILGGLEELALSGPALTLAEIEEIVLGSYYDFPPLPPSLSLFRQWENEYDDIEEERRLELAKVAVAARVSSFYYRSSRMTKKKGMEEVKPKLRVLEYATNCESLLNSVLLAEESGLDVIIHAGEAESKEMPKVGWGVKNLHSDCLMRARK